MIILDILLNSSISSVQYIIYYLKLFIIYIFSFKERGARYALMMLSKVSWSQDYEKNQKCRMSKVSLYYDKTRDELWSYYAKIGQKLEMQNVQS